MRKLKRMTQPDWLRFWRLVNIGLVLVALLVPYRMVSLYSETDDHLLAQYSLSHLGEIIAWLDATGKQILHASSLLVILAPLVLIAFFALCVILACRYFVVNLLIALSSRPGGGRQWLFWRIAGMLALTVLFPLWTSLSQIPAWIYEPARVSFEFLPGWAFLHLAFLSWLAIELVALVHLQRAHRGARS